MLKSLFLNILLALIATSVALAQETGITVAGINTMGVGRYTAVEPVQVQTWAVFASQEQYKSEDQFEGYALSTAGALGLTNGYNEMPFNKAVLVTLNPLEPIRYNGSEYWLDNCKVGGKPYKNRFKPVNPPDPPATPAAPEKPQIIVVNRPCEACSPAPLPICHLGGDLEKGFVGLPTNGKGSFVLDGNETPSEVVDGTDILVLNQAALGTHLVVYTVTGPLGSVSCEAKFDIFASQTSTGLVPTVTIPHIGFCDNQYGWREFLKGMAYPVVCEPGQLVTQTVFGGAAGFGLSRIGGHATTAVAVKGSKVVPGGGTISPP